MLKHREAMTQKGGDEQDNGQIVHILKSNLSFDIQSYRYFPNFQLTGYYL